MIQLRIWLNKHIMYFRNINVTLIILTAFVAGFFAFSVNGHAGSQRSFQSSYSNGKLTGSYLDSMGTNLRFKCSDNTGMINRNINSNFYRMRRFSYGYKYTRSQINFDNIKSNLNSSHCIMRYF